MKILNVIIATAFIATGSAVVHANESNDKLNQNQGISYSPDLEPCMNGSVSASGLYPTQEAEFAALEIIVKDKQITPKK
jgi:hypothetical protein